MLHNRVWVQREDKVTVRVFHPPIEGVGEAAVLGKGLQAHGWVPRGDLCRRSVLGAIVDDEDVQR